MPLSQSKARHGGGKPRDRLTVTLSLSCIRAYLIALIAIFNAIGTPFFSAQAAATGAIALATVLVASNQARAQFPQVYMGPPAECQRDPNWNHDSLGWSNYAFTIGDSGCVDTCLAMTMSWYGVPTTPREMNEWLRANGGFPKTGSAVNKASVIWSAAAGRAPNVSYEGANYWRDRPADLSVVNSDVDQGYLLIAEVRMGSYVHYVLIIGRTDDGSNYFVIDPWDGQHKMLCPAFGKNPRAAIYSIQKYHLNDIGRGSTGIQRRDVIDAFYRAGIGQGGGRNVFQTAQNSMHTVKNVAMQDFVTNGAGQRALVDIGNHEVYGCFGAIGATWFQWGLVWGPIGRPRSDEFEAAPSFRGTHGRGQRYDAGSIYFASAYGANPVMGNISNLYEQLHGTAGRLGFPTGSQWAWNGYLRQDFEGGAILMDRNGNCNVYWW